MQEIPTAVSAGTDVIVRDERWTVVEAQRFDVSTVITLRGSGQSNRDELRRVVAPFDVVEHPPQRLPLRRASRHAVLRAAANTVCASVRWDECWSAATADIELHPWQLEPAAAAVQGCMRILLADAVGTGKTIAAALIIAELRARGLATRVLVLTPASIREQWARELSTRFGLTATIFDQVTLAQTAATLPPDVNPWTTATLIISSIDLVKRSEVRRALDGTAVDLLVVDEAHHLTPGSDRGALVADLAARVPWIVLATATPHSGDAAAYEFLTAIGASGDGDMRTFRRPASVRQSRLPRRSRTLIVTPTHAEQALLEAVALYADALSRMERAAGASLVAAVIARRSASCSAAALRTLERRLDLLTGDAVNEHQDPLPWQEGEALDGDVPDRLLGAPGLGDSQHEIDWLRQLIQLAREAATISSKLRVVRRLLRRLDEQLIVFSEYRDVAVHVMRGVQDLATVAALHGGMSARERNAVVEAFNTGRVRTLAATDAAGEGLNLHARCRLIVNMELPWTPARLEQRIGRVDRIGQTRRVHAIHLVHRGSYEDTVIARLEERRTLAARFESSDEAPARPSHSPTSRRFCAQLQRSAFDGQCAVYAPQRGRTLLLLFTFPILDGRASVVQREMVALCARSDQLRKLQRGVLRQLVDAPEVRCVIGAVAAERVRSLQQLTTPTSAAIEHRLLALLTSMGHVTGSSAWQPSLFDKRAERGARQAAADAASVREHLERRAEAARQLGHLHAGKVRLVAAWSTAR